MSRTSLIAALTAAALLALPTASSAGHGKRDHDWFKSFRADWDARRAKWDAGWRAHDAKWRKDWAAWDARWAKRHSGSK